MRYARESNRAAFATGLSLVATAMTLGCATVNPQSDYARAHELISRSTGVADAYSPEKEGLGPDELEARLAEVKNDPRAKECLANVRQRLEEKKNDAG